MSPAIWTQCEGKSRLAAQSTTAFRIVEDQSKNSTRKLVDSDAEQERLETLIEGIKPPLPRDPSFAHLHYLLATPFRYPPLRWGSRFRRRRDPGVWYGSQTIDAALAEKAYYRLLFLQDTAADLSSEVILTSFETVLQSSQAIDLTEPPFSAYETQISNPATYAFSQPLGVAMRQDHVTFCFYRSARDPQKGKNVAVFSPLAFAEKKVADRSRENWYSYATRHMVEFHSQRFSPTPRLRFPRSVFEMAGQFPIPDFQ